jgi:hypothetical protein
LQRSELASEAAKASVPVGVSLASLGGMTLHDWVMLATLGYIVLQAAFLVYKWIRLAARSRKG